jgi:hypothetical protein
MYKISYTKYKQIEQDMYTYRGPKKCVHTLIEFIYGHLQN